MFAVEMLPAGHGDALVVEWGTTAEPHRLLIDAGTDHSWDEVRTRLKQRRNDMYSLFVVTHVDEDHIGGAISLLDDPDLRHRVSTVWFNGYVHCDEPRLEREGSATDDQLNVLGPVNGEELTERIRSRGLGWNPTFPWGPVARRRGIDIGGPIVVPDEGALPTVDLDGGARLVVLSPTNERLERMAGVWKEKVIEAGLVPGGGSADHTQAPSPFEKDVPPLPDPLDRAALKRLAARRQSDGSEANGSSIAFVLEFAGKRVLLTGDAHPSVLADSLARYGAMVGEPQPRLDLVKLSHHGSGANLTRTLAGKLLADRFLVSSDGRSFGHPDDSTVARLILASADRGAADGPTFYCNYRSNRTDEWADRAPDVTGAVVPTFVRPKAGAAGLRVPV
jgi:beta-lactamase superfamily II metal-dependent hydrolase